MKIIASPQHIFVYRLINLLLFFLYPHCITICVACIVLGIVALNFLL